MNESVRIEFNEYSSILCQENSAKFKNNLPTNREDFVD